VGKKTTAGKNAGNGPEGSQVLERKPRDITGEPGKGTENKPEKVRKDVAAKIFWLGVNPVRGRDTKKEGQGNSTAKKD